MLVPASPARLVAPPREADVAVVGAGAAGIAATRYLVRRGLRVATLEARSAVAGRAVTASFGGHPVDLGAHWLHAGEMNPLVPLARSRGEPLRRAPGAGALVLDGRFASAEEARRLGEAFERADAAFGRAGKADTDTSLAAAMPPLGPWGAAIAATMALVSGRPLREVSVKDFPSEEFGNNYFVRGGYGAYLSRLASGLPVALATPVEAIDWSGEGVRLATPSGTLSARAAVVTVPIALLAGGGVRFTPGLPDATAEAIAAFLPGTYEHVILNWPGSPFRGADRLVKLMNNGRSAGMMTNIDGAPFHYFELDRDAAVSLRGGAARGRYARDVLAGLFGARAIGGARVLAATDWDGDPWSRCAWAVVPPGRVGARAALGTPIGDRVWLAGEANSDALWGTVGGAWQEGERAAAAAADRVAGPSP